MVLRKSTQNDHERVDDLFSKLTLSDRDDLVLFFDVHLTCFELMEQTAKPGSAAQITLHTMSQIISRDLAALGAISTPTELGELGAIEPLALDYMIEGSRLGTRVLKKRWETATDPKVKTANAYFTMGTTADRWRDVCEALTTIPAESSQARAITQDTKKLFSLFYDVSRKKMSGTATPELVNQ